MSKVYFWQKKIESWSHKQYSRPQSPILKRLIFAINHWEDKELRVVDIGCGLGYFSSRFKRYRTKPYGGIDYLGVDTFSESPFDEKYGRYLSKQVLDLSKRDIEDRKHILSLGLIDWIGQSELEHLLELSRGKSFIHSFTEKKWNFSGFLYYLYRSTRYIFFREPIPIKYGSQFIAQVCLERGLKFKVLPGPFLVRYIVSEDA